MGQLSCLVVAEMFDGSLGEAVGDGLSDAFEFREVEVGALAVLAGAAGDDFSPGFGELLEFLDFLIGEFLRRHDQALLEVTRGTAD